MTLGPIEMLMIRFPGNQSTGEIVPAMAELVENGTIHIVDLLFIQKDAGGAVTVQEWTDLAPDVQGRFAPLANDITRMLNDDDAHELAASLENGSSAGIMLFENIWAARFAQAVRNANGEVLLNERIPHAVIEEVLAQSGTESE
jgi:uncharacterized membrane protein